ncbi:MAG: hypothetical protein ACOX1I_07090 [Dethiobacteria bacterium]
MSSVSLDEEEQAILAEYKFLTEKPLIVALNIDEHQLAAGDYPEKGKGNLLCCRLTGSP